MIDKGIEVVEKAVNIIDKAPIDDVSKKAISENLGSAAVTVSCVIKNALLPLKGFNWMIEKAEQFFEKDVKERIKKIPEENLITPKNSLVGNTLESIKYLENDEQYLKDMYASLLANACDKTKVDSVHPSFIEIIRQLSYRDVLLLEFIQENQVRPFIRLRKEREEGVGVDVLRYLLPELIFEKFNHGIEEIATSLENLERLKLIYMTVDSYLTNDALYESIRNEEHYVAYKNTFKESFAEKRGIIRMSDYGETFMKYCIN